MNVLKDVSVPRRVYGPILGNYVYRREKNINAQRNHKKSNTNNAIMTIRRFEWKSRMW